jgi:hypothetical protein
MKVKLQVLDTPSITGRIYTADSFKSFPDVVYGYAEMPKAEEMTIVDLTKVTHTVKNLRIEDGCLVGDLQVIHTPVVKALESMGIDLRKDSKYAIAGTGKVDETGKVTEFALHSVNLVPKDEIK